MKIKNYILILAMALLAIVGCTPDKGLQEFSSDKSVIEFGANGGVEKVKILSDDEWVASVGMQGNGEPNPWITISPANGRGSVTCDFIIDSALTTMPREASVSIRNIRTNKERRIKIKQEGYAYNLEVDNTDVEVKKFAEYGKRYFDVTVKANFPFEVEIPQSAQHWISRESATKLGDAFQLNLNRGVRPREVKVRFNWKINNSADIRLADIKFVPTLDEVSVASSDILSVKQEAAEKIKPNTREGDSLALLNIVNTMQCWNVYDSSTTMDTWNGVTLWEERMTNDKAKIGRVKSVEIFLCNSYEGLPYEIRYLTEAEEIYIFSNENSMLKSIDLGEDILELKNLKRLTVGAFGLSSLPKNFAFPNLEYLDLGSNNFQKVPEVINPTNLPKLRALVMNAQQRHAVSDLTNTRYTIEELGGLIEEETIPERLLLWGEDKQGLDTLVLSVNYLHGSLPTFEGSEYPKWSAEDIAAANAIVADSLPQALIGTPKIMTKTKTFRINHNNLSGEVPTWLLMHPALDWWIPFSLVFPQEGRDANGVKGGFSNAPANLVDYYTKWYPKKKLADSINEEIPEDDSEILGK